MDAELELIILDSGSTADTLPKTGTARLPFQLKPSFTSTVFKQKGIVLLKTKEQMHPLDS